MTTPIRSGSEHIRQHTSEDVNRHIDNKDKFHHHFHGAHSKKEEKKRLKKLVHQLERMLSGKEEQDSGKPTSKTHQQKMLHNRLKDGLNDVKKRFGLHDDSTEHTEEHPRSRSNKGLQKKMLNYRFNNGSKDKFKSAKNSDETEYANSYSNSFSSTSVEEDINPLLYSAQESETPHESSEKGNSSSRQNLIRDEYRESVSSSNSNGSDEEASEKDNPHGGKGIRNSTNGHTVSIRAGYTGNTLNGQNNSTTEALNIGNALVVNSVLSEKEKEKEKGRKNKNKRKSSQSVKSGSKTSGSGHVNNIVDADNALAAEGDIVLSGGIAVLYLFMNLLSDLAQYKYVEMRQKAKVSRDAQEMANRVNELIAKLAKRKDSDTATVQLDPDVIKYMEDNNIQVDDKSIDEYLKSDGSTPTNVDLKSADGKYSINVYKEGDQWYMKSKSGDPQQIDPPTFKDGKVTFTTKNDYDSGGVKIPKGTEFDGHYDAHQKYRSLNKGELNAVKSALENESNRASDFVSQSQLQLQKIMQTYNVTVSLINSMQTLLEEMNKSIAQNIR